MNPSLVVFGAVLAVSFVLLLFVTGAEPASKSTRQRIVAIQNSMRTAAETSAAFYAVLAPRKSAPWLGALFQRLRIAGRLEQLVIQADSQMSLNGVLLSSAGCAVVGSVATMLFGRPILAMAAAALGAISPWAWLSIRRKRRLRAFDEALPDAIDLLARALRAGHSMGSAVEMVGEQSPQPLAFEFVQVFQQQRLGLPFRDALMQMCQRVTSRDLHFLVTAILIQKETGGDLTEILDRTAHVIRERIRIGGEVRTKTAQGRLTGWILAMLPVVMLALLNLVNPGYSDVLFHDPQGRALLYVGGGLILLGALIIRKIVDVKV